MSKYHYYIISKKPLKEINNEHGRKTIQVSEVEKIDKNKHNIYSSNYENNGKQNTVYNILLLLILGYWIFLIIILIAVNFLGFTGENSIYRIPSNFFALFALFEILFSKTKIGEIFGKWFYCNGRRGNMIFKYIMITILAVLLSAVFVKVGLDDKLANSISLLCVMFSIWSIKEEQ